MKISDVCGSSYLAAVRDKISFFDCSIFGPHPAVLRVWLCAFGSVHRVIPGGAWETYVVLGIRTHASCM